MKSLHVFYENHRVGILSRTDDLTYAFSYEDKWQASPTGFALSLAMPLEQKNFGNKITLSFFENLLPEGELRENLERTQQVSSPFDFLKKFGHDCAGAIIIGDENYRYQPQASKLESIDMNRIQQAVSEHESVADVIAETNAGYLSLAGAQDKFPAIYKDGKLFLPSHGAPTTHIVKAPIWRNGVKESVYNEHYCMQLAEAIGLKIPHNFILEGEHPLYVIERYDRYMDKAGQAHRIHQQDFCQAQGITSEQKYEEKGGPSIAKNYSLILDHVAIKEKLSAIESFLDWILFNLMIGNNDSHSKNISLLLQNGKISMAPFYDLLSSALYPKLKTNFSFHIGDRDRFPQIGKNQFEILENQIGLKRGTFLERAQRMNDLLMKNKDDVAQRLSKKYPKVKIFSHISDLIADRSKGLKNQKAIR